ncbi:MAG: hypothetical protein WCK67_01015 [bacterium]
MLKDFNALRNLSNNLDLVKKQDLQKTKQNSLEVKPNLTFGKNLLCSAEAGHAVKAQCLTNLSFKSKKEEIPELSEEELTEKLQDLQQNVPPTKIGIELMAHPEYIQGICKKGIKELNKEIKKETDPKKVEELEQMKNILECGMGGVEKSKKTGKLSFKGLTLEERDERAWGIVHAASAANAGIAAALAQAPGGDMAALQAATGVMALSLAAVYGLDPISTGVMTSIAVTTASSVGVQTASKLFTWFPGAGNALNAAVAAGVTEAAGSTLIGFFHAMCEEPSLQYKTMTKEDLKKYKK